MISLAKYFEEEDNKIEHINLDCWNKYYNEVKLYIQDNNKLPSKEENQKLYHWIRRQIALLRSKKDYSSEKYFKEFQDKKNKLFEIDSLKIYIQDELNFPSSRWDQRYNQVKKFIEENKRLPSESKNSDEEEKTIARWLTVQIQALRGNTKWIVSEKKRNMLLDNSLIKERYEIIKKRKRGSDF